MLTWWSLAGMLNRLAELIVDAVGNLALEQICCLLFKTLLQSQSFLGPHHLLALKPFEGEILSLLGIHVTDGQRRFQSDNVFFEKF